MHEGPTLSNETSVDLDFELPYSELAACLLIATCSSSVATQFFHPIVHHPGTQRHPPYVLNVSYIRY
jgi:hypothetical protein